MNFDLIKEQDLNKTLDEKVLPALDAAKSEGEFESFDSNRLFWRSYTRPDARKSVAILHGFTESCEKYHELIWYFFSSGSNVYIFDQRGHGKSFRHVPDRTITHVERFDDYISDFEVFTEKIVPKDLPRVLFSHSMGGAVAGLYLEKHPDVYEKAIFSSPMIAPSTGGYPLFVGKAICRAAILFGGAKKRIFLSSEYPGEEKFETSCDTSFERFSRYEKFRRKNPDYQNFSPSYRWTLESLNVTKRLLKQGEPEKIKAKCLLLSAGRDDIVLVPPQKLFAERIPDCEYVTFADAKHEIYYSTDDVMEPYVAKLLDFID
ncbi:MAG: alpha/beta hydrolase [Clostridia bacterium]|nr:alpha/beta hydrolase [Clostridia bacterium]